jgi:hypothetical protein
MKANGEKKKWKKFFKEKDSTKILSPGYSIKH